MLQYFWNSCQSDNLHSRDVLDDMIYNKFWIRISSFPANVKTTSEELVWMTFTELTLLNFQFKTRPLFPGVARQNYTCRVHVSTSSSSFSVEKLIGSWNVTCRNAATTTRCKDSGDGSDLLEITALSRADTD